MPVIDEIKTTINNSLTSFKQALRFDQLVSQLHLPPLRIPPSIQKYRIYLFPSLVILAVILIAMIFATALNSSNKTDSQVVLDPQVISSTPAPSYQSVAAPLKEIITNFNSYMPDPAAPDFDDQISLERLPQ